MRRLPAILLTLGLVAWFQEIFTVEWSFPYCSSQVDGPASAVFGMPFPYVRWSTVSSLEYFWMPNVLILNILILFVIAYPIVSWVVGKIEGTAGISDVENGSTTKPLFSRARLTQWATGLLGAFLVVTVGALYVFLIQIGIYKIPVADIAGDSHGSYTEFRPVRFGFKNLRYDCTRSDFWFPDGWQPK